MESVYSKIDGVKYEHFYNINDEMKVEEDFEKYDQFNQWMDDNDIIAPRIKFPVRYGKFGLIGAGCIEEIGPCEAFWFVPVKLIMRSDHIWNTEIGFILDEFQEVIDENTRDLQHFYLLLFLLYEKCKGAKSLWHPYFEIVQIGDKDLPHQWEEDEIRLLEDELFIDEVLQFKEDVLKEWEIIRDIANKYSDYFPKEHMTDENLNWCTNTVMTRGFGIGLNFTMIVPFADWFNHYNMDTGSELFCPKLHKVTPYDLKVYLNGGSDYQTKERMIVTYSDYYKLLDNQIEIKPPKFVQDQLQHSYNRYWKKVKNREEIFWKSIEELQQSDKPLWEQPYSSSTDTEDDEDESDDDVYDVVDEGVEEVKNSDGSTVKRMLLNADKRYMYNYTHDSKQNNVLIIQDRKQWK